MAALTLHPASDREPARLSMQGDLTIYEASETQQALLALLPDDPGPWTLDLSGLDDLDSAGVQVLLALQKTLTEGAQVTALSERALALVQLLRLEALYPASKE
ncbi:MULTISPECIES: STAS domain-containing protein [unclassified Pseudomonas]|uniref:STAS domain-containing protein n=1 Tax=unclassified Pseudomonas TaxID=196821 RepID=UPI0021CA6CCF|nr:MULTISPECIES: STAS domain-containing protein [unclassified Pseudomonas]MCU1731119.1 STAS domain-containing protein [Pseudomonas sp. 20P_3.2_Bac4]MCU1743662.1 STAS domain-containing protein [Pseudomonas sp. 20P_3.2_Bac5]